MSQFRGPGTLKFTRGLIHDYSELVVKMYGIFNVSLSH